MKNSAFEGFETFVNATKMIVKMHGCILLMLFTLQSIWLYNTLSINTYEILALVNWAKIHVVKEQMVRFPLPDGRFFEANSGKIKQIKQIQEYINATLIGYLQAFKKTAIIYLVYPLLLLFFHRRSTDQSGSNHIRGAQMVSAWNYKKILHKKMEKTRLPLGSAPIPILNRPWPLGFGKVRIPSNLETQHLILVGKSGCGKTTAMGAIIQTLLKAGERLVVYDSKGDFVAKFFNPETDFLWNPVDDRSLRWSVFNDIKYLTDIYSYANSQIPPEHGKHAFWSNTARDVFIAVLKYLYKEGRTRNRDIWEMIIADDKIIGELLKEDGQLAAKYLASPDSDTAKSIMSSLVSCLQSYEFIADNDGDFCIGDWVENGTGSIYISSLSNVRDTLKPLISIFIDTLSKNLLAQKDYPKRKTFIILEELWTLQYLPTLMDLITQSRSKGGALFLSVQEIAQLDTIYGSSNRKTIFNNCGSKLIMATAESETANYLSDLIGDQEIMESSRSYSLGIENFKDGININRSIRTRRVLMPSEIKALKNLHGIAQISGYHPFPVTFKYRSYPDKEPAVVVRDSNRIESLLGENEVSIEIL